MQSRAAGMLRKLQPSHIPALILWLCQVQSRGKTSKTALLRSDSIAKDEWSVIFSLREGHLGVHSYSLENSIQMQNGWGSGQHFKEAVTHEHILYHGWCMPSLSTIQLPFHTGGTPNPTQRVVRYYQLFNHVCLKSFNFFHLRTLWGWGEGGGTSQPEQGATPLTDFWTELCFCLSSKA